MTHLWCTYTYNKHMINIPRADDEHTAHTQKSVLGATSKTNKQYIYRHCPNSREGGQPHFKKFNRKDFLTKVGRGRDHKHIVKNRSTLFCMIYYSNWPNQGTLCHSDCTPDPQKVIRMIENVNSKPKISWFCQKF